MPWFDNISVIISTIAVITIKNVDYHCVIHEISKFEAINFLKNSVLEDHGYIYIYIYICVCVCVCVYMYMYIYICVYIHIYKYIYIYI